MSKVGIKLNLPGINAVMKSEGIKKKLRAAGEVVAANARSLGKTYTAGEARDINWISIVNVYPDDKAAGRDNFKNNTLLKALQAAGLPLTKKG